MHKSTAQSLAPELERIVAEGRDELSRREAEGDRSRRQLAESLRTEGDTRFSEFQKLCRERYSGVDADRRNGLVASTRLQEARSRHDSECAALSAKFERERRGQEEEFDKTRRGMAESHRSLLQAALDNHVAKGKELITAHTRETAMLTEQLSADRNDLAKKLERDRGGYLHHDFCFTYCNTSF